MGASTVKTTTGAVESYTADKARRCGCDYGVATLFMPLFVIIALWTANYSIAGRPVALLELMALLLAYAVAGEVVIKMWERLEWPLTREIFFYGAVSAAMAAAVFLIFPRAVSWYELGIIATFFAHGAFIVLLMRCFFDKC